MVYSPAQHDELASVSAMAMLRQSTSGALYKSLGMTHGSQTSRDQVLVECSSLFRSPAIPELIELINTKVLRVKPTKRPKGVCEPHMSGSSTLAFLQTFYRIIDVAQT
jgi:hypothetical protein